MRHPLLLLLGLVLLTTACSAPKPIHYPEKTPLLTHMGRSTVALVFKDGDETRPYCTGAFINDTLILTASHCMEGLAGHFSTDDKPLDPLGIAVNYIVEDEVVGLGETPKAVHNAISVKIDHDHDLALIETVGDVPSHDIAGVAKYSPSIGSTVYIVGHPHGFYWRYMEGTVSNYRKTIPGDDRTASYLEVDSHMFMGNSGGAIFNGQGSLVAVAESINQRIPGIGWCVSLDNITEFLYPAPPVASKVPVKK